MAIILLVLLLALILGGLGFAVHVLWWIALAVLVLWLIGFLVRVGEGTSRSRWYRAGIEPNVRYIKTVALMYPSVSAKIMV